jgi:hypothetical protein
VKEFGGQLSRELLHLPHKAAGVEDNSRTLLARELLHLPDKPAGVRRPSQVEQFLPLA